jgi:uncharacterized lipoprotein YbaY
VRRPSIPLTAAVFASMLAGAILIAGPVRSEDARPAGHLPYADVEPGWTELPTPIDRVLRGHVVSVDPRRVRVRYEWASPDELRDFERFVPVHADLDGEFTVQGGKLRVSGTVGIRHRVALLPDLSVDARATLPDPHDAGVVLADPWFQDRSVVCLVQDRFFTRFDRAAGNSNMINQLGAVADARGSMPFRYIARRRDPVIDAGATVHLVVTRKARHTSFDIDLGRGDEQTLAGTDPGTSLKRFCPGLYVAGVAAEFGPLEIEGEMDPDWLRDRRILPQVADDLTGKANGFQGPALRAAQAVEEFARGVAAAPAGPAPDAALDRVAGLLSSKDLPLVVRIRAAEALVATHRAGGLGAGESRILAALRSEDAPARTLAWQVLRPHLPWHFGYDPTAAAAARAEAAGRVEAYLSECDAKTKAGLVPVEGRWCTPQEADAARADWAHAWDLRGAHVRLRTNLPRASAEDCLKALEAGFEKLVALNGRELQAPAMPLSVLVFSDAAGFRQFCAANGYAERAASGEVADLERGVAILTMQPGADPRAAVGVMARVFLRVATGRRWPAWFEEGRAAWFGDGDYDVAAWQGEKFKVGLPPQGPPAALLASAAAAGRLPSIAEFLATNPAGLDVEAHRLWRAQAWGLHHYLLVGAPHESRIRFTHWFYETSVEDPVPADVDAEGRSTFLATFRSDLSTMDAAFRAWAKQLAP